MFYFSRSVLLKLLHVTYVKLLKYTLKIIDFFFLISILPKNHAGPVEKLISGF